MDPDVFQEMSDKLLGFFAREAHARFNETSVSDREASRIAYRRWCDLDEEAMARLQRYAKTLGYYVEEVSYLGP